MPKASLLIAGAAGVALAPAFLAPGAGVPVRAPARAEEATRSVRDSTNAPFRMANVALPALGLLAAGRRAARSGTARAAEAAAAEPEPEVFDPRKEPGVTLPLMYFDPLGFAKEGDREGFYQLRAAELKHGRVAMIASVGCVMQHNIKFPGFEDVPAGIKAAITPPGTYGLLAIIALAGALELTIFKQDPEMDPGDFGMGMVSFLGIVVAELATGKDGVEQIWTPLGNLAAE
eukprot:g11493.t1